MSSRKKISRCSACTIEKICESPLLNSNIEDFNYEDVQQSIVAENIRVCDTCELKTMETEENFHEIIAIDCESLRKCEQKLTSINNIQNSIILNDNEYELLAAIEFSSSLQHYIAHIKRKSNRWETYDDIRRTISETDVNRRMFIFMLFYQKTLSGMYF